MVMRSRSARMRKEKECRGSGSARARERLSQRYDRTRNAPGEAERRSLRLGDSASNLSSYNGDLYTIKKEKHDCEHEDCAQAAARIIAPVSVVWPRRNNGNDGENRYGNKEKDDH